MAKADPTTRERPRWSPPTNGHWLIGVSEWLPVDELTDEDVDLPKRRRLRDALLAM